MRRGFVSLILVSIAFQAFTQKDTVILEDYVKIMVSATPEGKIEPLTNIKNKERVGFFLSSSDQGMIRICNNQEIMGWVDGRLVLLIEGCEFFDPSYFFRFSASDTVYLSFSSAKFDSFRCERVAFDELIVVKEESPNPRKVRDFFREFNIIAISILIFSFAVFSLEYPSRLSFFINKTYSLKASSYQFINTSFFGRPNVVMMVILSLCIGFELIYIGHYTKGFYYDVTTRLGGYLLNWITITFWILCFFLVKRILIQFVANLFKMRKLRDWQLFDLINFVGYFALILFMIILWDFTIKSPNNSWITIHFSSYFLVVLILFEIWFIIKFVTNSSYRKLLIISYLCATEIIPSIFFIEWFFK